MWTLTIGAIMRTWNSPCKKEMSYNQIYLFTLIFQTMKKVLLMGLAAAAMLASCSNDETLEMASPKAISFSNAFVNNGTRSIVDPSFTTETLGNFAVYGYTTNATNSSALIFNGTEVKSTDKGATWSYEDPLYWVPGNTYHFSAIAPKNANVTVANPSLTGGMIGATVTFTSDGATDLLHAATVKQVADEVFMADVKPVGLTFNHQLAKVKFSFENAVGAGYSVKVTNVKITDAYTTGTLTIGATNAWSGQTNNTLALDFGNVVAAGAAANTAAEITNAASLETYNEKLMIPSEAAATYNVTFSVELLQNGVSVATADKKTTISGVALQLGYCYDFKASLTKDNVIDDPMKKIEFTVDGISPWNDGGEQNTGDIEDVQ